MTVKRYVVNYDNKSECCFDIDHAILTKEKVNEISEFWSDHEDRLDENGSALNGVLKLLTWVILRIQVEYDYNLIGVLSKFDYNAPNGGIEGWPVLDGSYGITLIKADSFDFDESDMTVEVIK